METSSWLHAKAIQKGTEKFDNGRLGALASAPIDWIQPMTKRKNPSIVDATSFTTQAGLL